MKVVLCSLMALNFLFGYMVFQAENRAYLLLAEKEKAIKETEHWKSKVVSGTCLPVLPLPPLAFNK